MTVAGRSRYRTSLWLGASLILSVGARFVPDSAVGLWATLFALSAACTVAGCATIDWRVIPIKRPEFVLFGALFVVLAALMFAKSPSTVRALVMLVCVLFAATIVMMIRGLVDMFRMVRRARANNPNPPS
jgi:FlaA1/EpsC-like NDP-sugar epimerase